MSTPSILITNAMVVTMNPAREVIERGFVAIDEDRIVAIGDQAACPYETAARVIDAAGDVVFPGLVNAHTHSFDILLRGGVADDLALYDWLLNVSAAGTAAFRAGDYGTAVRLHCLEAIRSGITTTVDLAETEVDTWDEVATEALHAYTEAGMRTVFAESYYDVVPPELSSFLQAMEDRDPGMDRKLPMGHGLVEQLARIEELVDTHHGRADGRIHIWPAPTVALYSTRQSLLGAKDLARRRHLGVTLHIAESPHDRMQHGVSSVQYLAGIGFLGPEVLAAHCAQVDVNDIRALKAFDVKIANNPVSNMFLGNGTAPIAEMLTAGITVGIGTDDGDCNNGVNLIADLRVAALAQKNRYCDPTAITAEQVLEMATIGGARAIGLDHEIGSLEVGKKADLFLLDRTCSTLVPFRSPASALVYQANGNEVHTVLIDGRLVLDQRAVTWLPPEAEAALLADAQAAHDRAVQHAGLRRYRSGRWATRTEIYTGA